MSNQIVQPDDYPVEEICHAFSGALGLNHSEVVVLSATAVVDDLAATVQLRFGRSVRDLGVS
jgi:hypothetical protein